MSGRTLEDAMLLVHSAAGKRGFRHYDGSGAFYAGDIDTGPPEASFTDWGLAESVTVILNAVVTGKLIPAPPSPEDKHE